MLVVKVLSEIVRNNRIVGYSIKSESGDKMDVKIEYLIDAVRRGVISISNAYINNNGILVKKENKNVNPVNKPAYANNNNAGIEKAASRPVANQGVPSVKAPEKVAVNPVANRNERMDRSIELKKQKELTDKLNKARKVYEQGKDEIMSNFEYDKLYDELVALEKKTGTVLADSPTHNVGYEVVSNLEKKTHETPMLSLDKTKDREALVSFLQGREGVLSWKLDGLTVVLTYNNGELESAVTRGNGTVGELVTNNAKQFKNIPHRIPFKGKLVVRGEATISYSTFEKINNNILNEEEKYKNPRNLCSGSVRQLDSRITAQRNVNMYIFELVEAQGINVSPLVDEQFLWLKSLGFQCVEWVVVSPKNTAKNNVLMAVQYFEQHIESNDIPSDGLVLTFRDKQFGLSLGRTSKAYRHSIAFKWQDEMAESVLLGIEWQVGRSGIITPVAVFKPVNLEGSTVERASLHNISVMLDVLGRPYIGQRIKIYKANMIIPQIAWGEKIDG